MQGSSEKLKEAVFLLNEGVRWGRIHDVLSHVDPESQTHYIESHKGVGSELKITGYEVVSTQLTPGADRAQIGVKFTWYRIDRMEVHETVVLQSWQERNRIWLLVAEEHRSGVPLGI